MVDSAKTPGGAPIAGTARVGTKTTSARGTASAAFDAKTRRASATAAADAARDPTGVNRCHQSLAGRPPAASRGETRAAGVNTLPVGRSSVDIGDAVGAAHADQLLVVRPSADAGQVVDTAHVYSLPAGGPPAVAPEVVDAARADLMFIIRSSADAVDVVGADCAAPLLVGRPPTAAGDVAGAAASLIGRPSVAGQHAPPIDKQFVSDSQLIAACGLEAAAVAAQHHAMFTAPGDVTDSWLVRADLVSSLNATASAFTPRVALVPTTVDVDYHALLRDDAVSSDDDVPSMAWSSLGADALPETQGTDAIDMFVSPPVDSSVWPEYVISQVDSPAAPPPAPLVTRLPQPTASTDRKRSHQLVSSDASSVSKSSSSSSAGKQHKSGAVKRRNRREREVELTATSATADDFRSSERKPQQRRR